MKTQHNRSGFGRGLVLGLVLITCSTAFGGAPQTPAQRQRERNQSAAASAVPVMSCKNCKTEVVTEFSATNPSGKYSPRYRIVGSRHTCATCEGAITVVRGQTTNEMKANCPVCAKADTSCCSDKG
jgi:hypothetical protein